MTSKLRKPILNAAAFAAALPALYLFYANVNAGSTLGTVLLFIMGKGVAVALFAYSYLLHKAAKACTPA